MSASGAKPKLTLITSLETLRDQSKVLMENKNIDDKYTNQAAKALNTLAITFIKVKKDNSISLSEANAIHTNLILLNSTEFVPRIYGEEINSLSKIFLQTLKCIDADPNAFSFINFAVAVAFDIKKQGKLRVQNMIEKITKNIQYYEKLRDFLSSTARMGIVPLEMPKDLSPKVTTDPKPAPATQTIVANNTSSNTLGTSSTPAPSSKPAPNK